MQNTLPSHRLPRSVILSIAIGILLIVALSMMPAGFFSWLWDRMNVFATVFLGIFIEAVPYLLLGTLASGLVEVFLDRSQMSKWISRRPVASAVGGALMGLIFPVCECGVVPLTRRLFNKGLPLPAGIAFLLAAPVLNPIVVLSTAAAFGWGNMLFWRMGISMLIAVTVGIVFSTEQDPANILRPILTHDHDHDHTLETGASFSEKVRQALLITADEFFEMGRYLIIGAMLAAGLQTFIAQSSLLAIGSGPVLSVLVMLGLAVLLSICSTVDAFVALGFTGAFSFGSVLSFLVFGPMVDIKSIIMYLQVFKRRPVVYLAAIPFMMSLLAGVLFNYFQPLIFTKANHMDKRLYRSLQALLLLGMCIFLASKAANGQLTYYINQRFIPLTILGIISLAALAQTMFTEIKRSRRLAEEDEHDHGHAPASANLWFMLVPILIGVLIPARPLDSSSFTTKGFNTNAPLVSADSSAQLFETASQERNVLDWIKLFNYESDPSKFTGEQASVIGFVYFDEQLGENQFFVSRFVVSCCAADGFAVAIAGEWEQASTLEKDSWVLVKGSMQSITLNDQVVPLIKADSVQVIPMPEQPYLFP